MAEASDRFGILHQNLLDAGCNEDTVEICMKLAQQDKWEKIPEALKQQKTNLLNQVHSNQKQIDCLDFLVYQIERKNKEK